MKEKGRERVEENKRDRNFVRQVTHSCSVFFLSLLVFFVCVRGCRDGKEMLWELEGGRDLKY